MSLCSESGGGSEVGSLLGSNKISDLEETINDFNEGDRKSGSVDGDSTGVVEEQVVEKADSTNLFPPQPKAAKKKQNKRNSVNSHQEAFHTSHNMPKHWAKAKPKGPHAKLPPNNISVGTVGTFGFFANPEPIKRPSDPNITNINIPNQQPSSTVPDLTSSEGIRGNANPTNSFGLVPEKVPVKTETSRKSDALGSSKTKPVCYAFHFPTKDEMDYIARVSPYVPEFSPQSAIYFADSIAALISDGASLNVLVHILRNKLESIPVCQYWVRNLMLPPGPTSCHEVLRSFRDRFVPDPSESRRRLEKMHQGNWSVLQYVDRFMEAAVTSSLSSREILRLWIDGLNDETRFHLKARSPHTLEQASAWAAEFEEGERRRQSILSEKQAYQQHNQAGVHGPVPNSSPHFVAGTARDNDKKHSPQRKEEQTAKINFVKIKDNRPEAFLSQISGMNETSQHAPAVGNLKVVPSHL